jgi:hypothetical protein
MSGFVGPVPATAQYWLPEYEGKRHEVLQPLVYRIRSDQRGWQQRDYLHATLYAGRPIRGLGPTQYAQLEPDTGHPRVNLVKAVIDTYVSVVCEQKPLPFFTTTHADWSFQRRAKGMQRFIEAKYDTAKFHNTISIPAKLDSAIYDAGGWCMTYIADADDEQLADVAFERVYPFEIVIDDIEAATGRPRTISRRKWFDREVLCQMYPSMRSQIRDCPTGADYDDGDPGRNYTCDQILMTETYHLRSGRNAKDGMRTVWIANEDLEEKPWVFDWHPFDNLHRMPPMQGMRGISLVHELRPIQLALNSMLADFVDSAHLMGRPKWQAPRTANITQDQIDDDIASLIEHDGMQGASVVLPPVIPPDVYRMWWDLYREGYNLAGVNAARASGTVPSHLRTGRAIDLHNDVQTGRFKVDNELYQEFHIGPADKAIELARLIAKKNPKYAGQYVHKTYVEIVYFNKVDMDRDKYLIRRFPVSAFGSTPEAKLGHLQDLYDRGLIDGPTFRRVLDWPDIEAETDLLNAGQELAKRLVEKYLYAEDPNEEGLYISPDPDWPIGDMKLIFLLSYVKAKLDGAPEGNTGLLLNFIEQIRAIEEEAKKKAAANTNGAPEGEAPPGGPGGPPPGAPPPGGPPQLPPPPPGSEAIPPMGAAA